MAMPHEKQQCSLTRPIDLPQEKLINQRGSPGWQLIPSAPPSAGGPTRRVLRWFTASCLLSLHVAALGAPVEGGDKPTDAPYRATARTMSFNAAAAGTGYPAHYGSS